MRHATLYQIDVISMTSSGAGQDDQLYRRPYQLGPLAYAIRSIEPSSLLIRPTLQGLASPLIIRLRYHATIRQAALA